MLGNANFNFKLSVEPKFLGGGTTTTGTFEYCENNLCKRDGSLHCRYQSNEIFYLLTPNLAIPIKAYGTIDVTTYGFKKNVSRCETCELVCTNSGAKFTFEKSVTAIEICATKNCLKASSPGMTGEFPLPLEVVTRGYMVEMTAWVKDVRKSEWLKVALQLKYALPSSVREVLMNPKCANRVTIAIVAMACFIADGIFLMICKLGKIFFKSFSLLARYLLAPVGCWRIAAKILRPIIVEIKDEIGKRYLPPQTNLTL